MHAQYSAARDDNVSAFGFRIKKPSRRDPFRVMPTSKSVFRPSASASMSDENSDYDFDDEEVEATQDRDEDSDDENSFVVPASTKRSTNEVSKASQKVVSNGVKKTAELDELIICEISSSNSAGFGGVGASFDPLDTDERDPLDIQSGESKDGDNSESVPVIKIKMASKDEGWKIKRKSDTSEASEAEQDLPVKRVRTNRAVVSYAEIDDDDSPKTKRGRVRRDVFFTPQPTPKTPNAKSEKSTPVKKDKTPALVKKEKITFTGKLKLKTPVKEKTSPAVKDKASTSVNQKVSPSDKRKASLVAKEKVSAAIKEAPFSPGKSTPLSTGKRARRKRKDSEESFEIMPYKRRQFRGTDSVDVNEVDEDTKDDILRTSTPTPSVDKRQTKSQKEKDNVEDKVKLESLKDESTSVQQNLNATLTNDSVDRDSVTETNDFSGNLPKKRGRPRKSDPMSLSNDVTLDTTSRDSFASSMRRRKVRPSYLNGYDDDEETRMTFGFEDSTIDFLDLSDDGEFKIPKRGQVRPGPVKNTVDKTYPRLTADELERARETGWQCKVCGRKLANQWSLDTHFTTVHGTRTFSCDLCDKAFKRKDHLINHKRSIHLVKTKECMYCDLSFRRKPDLVAHMKTFHPKSTISTTEYIPGDESLMMDDSQKKRGRKKKIDSMLSSSEYGLLLPTKSSQKERDLLDESFDSVTGKRKRGRPRKISLEGKEFDKDAHRRCPDCKKVLYKAIQIPIHQRAWHLEHQCQLCYEIFEGARRLDRHLESHRVIQDDGSAIFACTICPGRFSKEVHLAIHARDFHREEHCLACGSCIIGARSMQLHVVEHHRPEKIFRDVFIHGYDSPEIFYQCSSCPRSFYDMYEAEHHFFTKHIVLGDCLKDLGRRPPLTWWPWAQLYPKMDIYADRRYIEREIRNIRYNLRREELEFERSLPPRITSRKSAPEPDSESESFGDEVDKILYQCELCEELFVDTDLLEEHLGMMHMATCFEFPDMNPDEWRLAVPRKELEVNDDSKIDKTDNDLEAANVSNEEAMDTTDVESVEKPDQHDEMEVSPIDNSSEIEPQLSETNKPAKIEEKNLEKVQNVDKEMSQSDDPEPSEAGSNVKAKLAGKSEECPEDKPVETPSLVSAEIENGSDSDHKIRSDESGYEEIDENVVHDDASKLISNKSNDAEQFAESCGVPNVIKDSKVRDPDVVESDVPNVVAADAVGEARVIHTVESCDVQNVIESDAKVEARAPDVVEVDAQSVAQSIVDANSDAKFVNARAVVDTQSATDDSPAQNLTQANVNCQEKLLLESEKTESTHCDVNRDITYNKEKISELDCYVENDAKHCALMNSEEKIGEADSNTKYDALHCDVNNSNPNNDATACDVLNNDKLVDEPHRKFNSDAKHNVLDCDVIKSSENNTVVGIDEASKPDGVVHHLAEISCDVEPFPKAEETEAKKIDLKGAGVELATANGIATEV